eukprot:386552-Rhodomonas_salina.1
MESPTCSLQSSSLAHPVLDEWFRSRASHSSLPLLPSGPSFFSRLSSATLFPSLGNPGCSDLSGDAGGHIMPVKIAHTLNFDSGASLPGSQPRLVTRAPPQHWQGRLSLACSVRRSPNISSPHLPAKTECDDPADPGRDSEPVTGRRYRALPLASAKRSKTGKRNTQASQGPVGEEVHGGRASEGEREERGGTGGGR